MSFRWKFCPPTAILLVSLLLFQSSQEILYAQVAVPDAQQLDQLLAPIALYPDALVAQINAASTNPQEILDVSGWLQQNSGLTGDALVNAAQQQGFDPAFIALLSFPQVLNMMAQNIDDYAAIGAAFSANQGAVMDSIQRLRSQAYASGALRSNQQLQVVQQPQGAQQIIVIQPANPQVVYVPQYDPAIIYAGPPDNGAVVAGLITFGAGIAIGAALANNRPWGWGGWGWNWGHRTVIVNHNTWIVNNNRYRPRRVSYRPRPVPYASRPGYGGNWRPGNRPGNNRPSGNYRPSSNNRPGPDNRPGGNYRPSSSNRPGGNYRPSTNNRPAPSSSANNRPAPPTNRPTPGARPVPSTARPAPAARPATTNRNPYAGFSQPNKGSVPPASRPTGSRPSAFGGAPSGRAEQAASSRGQRSMGGGAPRSAAPAQRGNPRKR